MGGIFGRNSIFKKPLGTGRNSVGGKLDELKKLVGNVTANLKVTANKAGKDIANEAKRASSSLSRAATKGKEDLNRELTWVKEDIDDEATRAKDNLDREATRLKQDLGREATKAKQNIDKEAKRAKGKADKEATRLKQNIDKELTRAMANVDREATRLREDISREATRIKEDFEKELTNAKEDIDEAVDAAVKFIESEIESMGDTITEAEAKLREGKAFDALWHLATEPIEDSKDSFVKAITQSELLGQAATVAVSFYGGPAGAAAYSAWLTYETTGSLEYAIRAGVAAGIASSGNTYVNGIPQQTLQDEFKRGLIKASINASAIAASGGSKEDIQEAFMSSATNSIQTYSQDVLQKWVKTEVIPRVGEVGQADIDEIEGTELIEKAKSLATDLQNFSEQWDKVKIEAEQLSMILNEAKTTSGQN